jgi:hypothetical protein
MENADIRQSRRQGGFFLPVTSARNEPPARRAPAQSLFANLPPEAEPHYSLFPVTCYLLITPPPPPPTYSVVSITGTPYIVYSPAYKPSGPKNAPGGAVSALQSVDFVSKSVASVLQSRNSPSKSMNFGLQSADFELKSAQYIFVTTDRRLKKDGEE